MRTTLLVVEADHETGRFLCQYLERQSFHPVLVKDLKQAQAHLIAHNPTAILLDLDEPDSWESFYQWLRAESTNPTIPCLWIATQFNDFALQIQDGTNDHLLQKPLAPDLFMQTLTKMTQGQNAPLVPKSTSPEDPKIEAWIQSLRGRTLGSAVLEREAGRGGMGVVFQGRQTTLNRQVAVKIMLPHLTKKLSTVERFRREALATAKLKSPHIVQIFEAGTTAEQLFFIVMEWLEGETLEQTLHRRGSLPALEALDMIIQTTQGLLSAHEAGLIHRDLKPSNLIRASNGHISITDFGLVYNQHTPRHTQSGLVVGTPFYLSPEQASGRSIDARSDIYALGILFYELLTGRVPFSFTSLPALLLAHMQKPLPDPREIVSEIPDSVLPVLQKMVAKEPIRRYQSSSELLQALEQLYVTIESNTKVSPLDGLEAMWYSPEPLQPQEHPRTQVTPTLSKPSPLLSGDLSYQELYKQATALVPSHLPPSSPEWHAALAVLLSMMVQQQSALTLSTSGAAHSPAVQVDALLSQPPENCLLEQTMTQTTQLFMQFVGPIGKLVIARIVKKMGYTPETFPSALAEQLCKQLTDHVKLESRSDFTKQCKATLHTQKVPS